MAKAEAVETTIEDDLRAAFDAQEEDNEPEEGEAGEAGRPDEDAEESVGAEEVEEGEGTEDAEPAEPDDAPPEKDAELTPEPDLVAKAPVSWTPAAREHWAKLPKDVQAMVAKRESQITKALEDGKENRKTGERFTDVVKQYQGVIAAEGIDDPVAGFKGLMNTVAGLRMGTASQKAAIVADMVKIYGVDINELDNVLSSRITGKQATPNQNSQLEAMLQEKLAPYQQFMDNVTSQRKQYEQQNQQRLNQEIDQFAQTHEFYNDVYMDMADLLDLAAKNGREMSMEQAYNAACAAHPEIAKVTQQRNYATNVAKKRQAASSISGKPAGNASPPPDDLRAALMQAFEG